MILSDRDIRMAINNGHLKIEPLAFGDIQPASVDIHINDTIKVWDADLVPVIDPADIPQDGYRTVDIRERQFVLRPGTLVLIASQEYLEIPNNLGAQVLGISTLGRLGVTIHSGSPWIDPGFKGTLTLEVAVSSLVPVLLRPYMRIAQLVFHQLTRPAAMPYGSDSLGSRYQGQRGVTPARQGGQPKLC